VIKPFIAANKTEGKLKAKTTDAPRKTHNAWSNKNIVSWKVTWFLPMKKGVPRGHLQALTLVLLGCFLGWHGHPQAWAFVHSLSHLIILQSLHLKTSFIQN
jgi:hypothetical protein